MASDGTDLDLVDRALMQLRRLFAPPAMVDDDGRRVEVSTLLVLEALADGDVRTVRDVAHRLDVAHSTASRFVTRAESSGMVSRQPSPVNRRETTVAVTGPGLAVRERGARHRRARLAEITSDWQACDVERFAADLHRFAEAAARNASPRG